MSQEIKKNSQNSLQKETYYMILLPLLLSNALSCFAYSSLFHESELVYLLPGHTQYVWFKYFVQNTNQMLSWGNGLDFEKWLAVYNVLKKE